MREAKREEKEGGWPAFVQPEPFFGASFSLGDAPFPFVWVAHHFCNFGSSMLMTKIFYFLKLPAMFSPSIQCMTIFVMLGYIYVYVHVDVRECMFHNLHYLNLNMYTFLCSLHEFISS